MSFNPWHALAEHRPMGGMNRLRNSSIKRVSQTALTIELLVKLRRGTEFFTRV